MAEQNTSIKVIMDKIMRHPLLQDLTLETAIDYTIDFMRIVGVPNMFVEKTELLNVVKYRTILPDDYYQTIQIRYKKKGMFYSFRYSNDSFHMSEDKRSSFDLTYKIQGNYIYTSLDEGEIELSYLALDIDDCGYPTIPDNSSFTRALEAYIKKQWFTILFDLNKISGGILQNTQQEYAWAVGDCQTEFNRLSLDKAESFYNSWRTLLLRDTEHSSGFINNGVKERIKVH